jgi:prepilin-type N-terminal cleavage/methylation domain-containing protein
MPPALKAKRLHADAGFSLSEMLVSMSVLGVLATVALPTAWTLFPAATARGAAREVQAVLNQARMVAIQTRQTICVQAVPGGVQLLQRNCAGAAWIGQDSNGAGVISLSNDVSLSGASPIFTPFGTASTTGVLTVTHSSGTSLTVTVQPSGQVTMP